MEDERKNHNVLLTVIGVTTLLVAMIGATFAYFSATATTDKQEIKTGELKVTANSRIENNKNIRPTDWDGTDVDTILDKAKDIAVITLTVNTKDTTITDAAYDIFLDAEGVKLNSEGGTGGQLSDIKWALFDVDTDNNLIGEGDFGEDGVVTEGNGKVTNLQVNESGKISITPNSDDNSHNYKLYIWIKESHSEQNQLQGLTISNATLRVAAQYGL